MFGMALRAYIRKLNRLSESSTERGQSLWQAVLDFVSERPVTSRAEVLQRFTAMIRQRWRGILHDLTETSLVFSTGSGDARAYRAVNDEEAATRAGRTTRAQATCYRFSSIARALGPKELLERSKPSPERLDLARPPAHRRGTGAARLPRALSRLPVPRSRFTQEKAGRPHFSITTTRSS